jgi:hypothetical protein
VKRVSVRQGERKNFISNMGNEAFKDKYNALSKKGHQNFTWAFKLLLDFLQMQKTNAWGIIKNIVYHEINGMFTFFSR